MQILKDPNLGAATEYWKCFKKVNFDGKKNNL